MAAKKKKTSNPAFAGQCPAGDDCTQPSCLEHGEAYDPEKHHVNAEEEAAADADAK